MYQRLLITIAAVGSAWTATSLLQRRQVALGNRASRSAPGRAGRPGVVYFWSHGCAVCRTAQRPILDRLVEEYGEDRVTLTAYCVDDAPEIAEAWGVRTLPTTFVLDASGSVKHVNNGLVAGPRLREQLEPR